MSNSGFLFFAAACLLTARSILGAELSPTGELESKGKPLGAWMAALRTPDSASAQAQQVEAEEAIHNLGPESIPAILRYRRGPRVQRLEVISHACGLFGPEGEIKIGESINDPDPTVRETALDVLPKTAFQAAIDDVLKRVADPVRPVRIAAILVLVRFAPEREETVGALIEVLHDAGPADRDRRFSRADAAAALGKSGPSAKGAVPELTALLGDSDDALREAAATALWQITREPSAVGVLAEILQSAREYQTCLRVMKVLGEMGAAAKPAAPVILKKIEEPGVSFLPSTVDLGQAAVEALNKIDPAAAAQARKKLGEAQ